MKKFSRIEKNKIINNVINKFMNEWGDMCDRYEMCVEYKLDNEKIIEIETHGNEDFSDKNYYMIINLYDSHKDHMTWRFESDFVIGKYWINEYYGESGINWKCDNTIKKYIKNAMNKIFKGIEIEKD